MEQQLNKLGFKKVHPDNVDKEYYYWQKNYKHKLIRGLHIMVSECITVYCKEPTNKIKGKVCNLGHGDVALIFKKKNIDNLFELDQWCKSGAL